jgi:hypothetical protein
MSLKYSRGTYMKESNRMSSELRFVDDFRVKKMRGVLSYTVFKNRVPIEVTRGENLILNGAGYLMAKLISGEFTGRSITKIGLGISGIAPQVTNETLTGSFEKNLDGYIFPAMGQVQFNWSLGISEANGMAILEFGLIAEDGTLFSRRIRENGKPINKESDISIIGQWIIIF